MAPTTSTTPAAPTPSAAGKMMCVPLTVFRLHDAREFDLYIWQEGDVEPTLYCSADVPLTATDLDRLTERGYRRCTSPATPTRTSASNCIKSSITSCPTSRSPPKSGFRYYKLRSPWKSTLRFR